MLRANQLRLWFASMAYVLLCALRRIGLQETQFADATCGRLATGQVDCNVVCRKCHPSALLSYSYSAVLVVETAEDRS
jgi:hypothetical protein